MLSESPTAPCLVPEALEKESRRQISTVEQAEMCKVPRTHLVACVKLVEQSQVAVRARQLHHSRPGSGDQRCLCRLVLDRGHVGFVDTYVKSAADIR